MAEINTEGQPIFVDVDSGQQFPTMFSQVITAEEASALADLAMPTKRIQRVKVQTTQNEPEGDTQPSAANTQEETAEQATTSTKTQYLCDMCPRYKADTEDKLIRHLRLHRGENPFQCGMCEYSTYNKAVFEEHVRVHQGIKPFKCSFCCYRSASKKNAKNHEKIHSDNNPNKCKDCNFIGRNPQSFRHHRETKHNSEKPKRTFTCKHCLTLFNTKAKYHSHRKNIKKCPQCETKCCNHKIFFEHMKVVHNKGIEACSKAKKSKENLFNCALCDWSSNSKPRVLLHLIHHPNQEVDENVIDLTVLRNCGIVE